MTPSSRISGVTVIGRRGSTNTHGTSNIPPFANATETVRTRKKKKTEFLLFFSIS
jgi:hypothetical protein